MEIQELISFTTIFHQGSLLKVILYIILSDI